VNLVLVRAGPPDFGDRLAGAFEVPLSPRGVEKARAAAGAVQLLGEAALVYHPPLGYAAEAGRLVSETLSVKARAAPDLAEPDMGLWQGLTEEELASRHPRAFEAFSRDARAVVPPEAEELDDARERLGRALLRIRRKHRREEKRVVVVAGELAFPLLVAAAEGKEAPRDLWRARRAGDDVRSFSLDET
jgi:broad specificity phosphatase PhoE